MQAKCRYTVTFTRAHRDSSRDRQKYVQVAKAVLGASVSSSLELSTTTSGSAFGLRFAEMNYSLQKLRKS